MTINPKPKRVCQRDEDVIPEREESRLSVAVQIMLSANDAV
jgi:hypothetical protein